MASTMPTFWDSPLGRHINQLQDSGSNVWVWGVTADQTHALVMTPAFVTIASLSTCNGVGRFEARRTTFDDDTDTHLRDRFPVRV